MLELLELTTTRLAAGSPLLSSSRGRFHPTASTRDPLMIAESGGLLPGDPSLDPDLEASCFRFVDAEALS